MTNFTTVFSSTAKDLQPYRDAVVAALLKGDVYHPLNQENFGACDGDAVETCLAKIAESEIFVGLIGHLHGSRPDGSDFSYTELEYQEAKNTKKRRFLFVAAEEFPLPFHLREPDDACERQKRFRKQVLRDRVVEFFKNPEELAAKVMTALLGEKESRRGRPKKRSGDLAQTETLYRRDLAERYCNLDFRGMGISDRVPLRLPLLEMYVPLKARVQAPAGETWARQMRLAGRPVSKDEIEGMGERLSEPQPVLDLLEKSPGLVLLGDPGSGKTTFLKYLALLLATGQGAELKLEGRLPVLVPLSAYANALALARKDLPLDRFLPRHFSDRGLKLPLADLIEKKLTRGELLLLFDGLDEVREIERRSLVVQRVQDFYRDHWAAGNKFVLTSRVVGYREIRPMAEGLAEATLVDFEDEEIAAFVNKWTAALEKAATGDNWIARDDAARERDELLAAVRGNPGVRSLAANPLLLTILSLMKRQGVTLPERRVELYQHYVETLLKHWNLARSLAGRPAKDLDLVDTLRILQPLALWMHETSPGVGLVKEWDLHQELERIFAERGRRDPERAARQFLEDVREHTSLLLDRGGRQYGFIHLTFQEYLAAAALAQKGQQEVGPIFEVLAQHVGEASWHEVSLLTLCYLGLVQQRDKAAGSVIEELLRQAPGPAGEAAVLAGRAVADMGAGAIPPVCREKVVKALVATLQAYRHVAPKRRAAAGVALAGVGDPRAEVMTVDGMEFCCVPEGPFLMGSQVGDNEAAEHEKSQHECVLPYEYWVARYPVTVAQFREFRSASVHGLPNQPVVGITWYDAIAFCVWLTARWHKVRRLVKGWEIRLPSEAEWEKAARGGLKVPAKPLIARLPLGAPVVKLKDNRRPARRYPWGEKAEPNRASFHDTGIGRLSSPGCFPSGASPYGCEELSGNAWEWSRSLWGERFRYPYIAEDGREDLQADQQVLRVFRGGSFFDGSRLVRCAYRFGVDPALRNADLGFRVVVAPSPL